LRPLLPWNHALKLQQPALSINAIPLQHAIKWIEERLVIHQRTLALANLLAVIQRIEEPNRIMIQRKLRQIEGKCQSRRFARHQCIRLVRVIRLHEDSARKVFALGNTINPRNRVFNFGARTAERNKLVNAYKFCPLILTIGRNRISAQVINPVSPMPPIVAANHSAFSLGLHCRCVPSERTNSKRRS
jgi:hypothetical protein